MYLIDAEDNFYYIISKKAVLVTEINEIYVGAKIQFIYPEEAVRPKVRKGQIIMESGKFHYVLNLICVQYMFA